MIRGAKFGDLPGMLALVREMQERSRYSHLTLDETGAKKMLLACVQRHGHQTAGGTCVFVHHETGGEIAGLIIGVLTPLYDVSEELMASDVMFYVSPRGHPKAAGALLNACLGWAEGNDRVAILRFGVTDAIDEDFDRSAAVLYGGRGFRRAGVIYERESS